MAQATAPLVDESFPPLHHGDLLSRQEFESRWTLHPEIKKAERIDGLVFVEVTVSPRHSKPHGRIMTWLGVYEWAHPETEAHDNVTVRIGDDDLQPDGLLRLVVGGASRSTADCIEGPPELAVEVAASSASYDMHVKKEAYRRGGVREYLVWQQHEKRIDWWELRNSQYMALAADEHGVIESRVFPGLRLNVPALLAGDLAAVLAAVMPAA